MTDEAGYTSEMPTTAMAPIPTSKRKPRFERVDAHVPIAITERDLAIVRFVGDGRFRTSRHIQAVFGHSQHILRRLTLLYRAGYLDRPRQQLEVHVKDGGSRPHVYALGDRGARLLNEKCGASYPDVDWRHKNAEVGRAHIEHTLAISQMHVALHAGRAAHPDIEVIRADTLVDAFPRDKSTGKRRTDDKHPFLWKPTVRRNDATMVIPVNPDAAFALGSPTVTRYYFLHEADRGTMPVVRADYTKTSIVRKFDAYLAGYRTGLHATLFGWKSLRILFTTDKRDRAEHMRSALCKLTKNPSERGLFYFAHADAIAPTVEINHSGQTGFALGQHVLEAEVIRVNSKIADRQARARYVPVHRIFGADVWIDGNGRPVTLI